MPSLSTRTASRILFAAFALSIGAWSVAQVSPDLTPNDLVRRAVANEIKSTDQSAKCMFREHKETPNGSQTKLMVQTRDAMAAMVVAYNGRPLNRDERQGEYGRIQRFIDDPSELERKRRKKKNTTPSESRAS